MAWKRCDPGWGVCTRLVPSSPKVFKRGKPREPKLCGKPAVVHDQKAIVDPDAPQVGIVPGRCLGHLPPNDELPAGVALLRAGNVR